MAQTIRIKRSTGSSAPSSLANAELSYSEGGDGTLYIGVGTSGANAASVVQIGGAGVASAITSSRAAGYVFAGPATGSNAAPTWRALTATDIPDVSSTYLTVSTASSTYLSQSSASSTYLSQAAASSTYMPLTGGTISSNLTISGNLTVNGTTTTVNSTTVAVADKNLELAKVASPTDSTADGAGITVVGATNHTWNWVDATDAWTSSEHIDLAAGKAFYINGTSVLSSSTLGSGVTTSSLTSVGTIGTGTWQGSTVAVAYGGTGATTLTGLVKGNGTSALTSAVAGTDYLSPSSEIDGGTYGS